ncbi:uncharacterized oxidoreductase C24B10.20 [Pundamilia nyererei]|uniref:Uncharacterized oxidoreductase C24B10.20 n=1 Tax=Pundamilia nyererei TaxID=303518 RepID=A0A9Y3S097_9CICH|nr:PREDICTED: uncharacterized oxidoreductase C24B10.20-like [Pundamilia nyererei]
MSAAMNFKKCGSVLITGASRGLGLQLVDSLASGQFSPGKIIATCRNPGNAQELQELAEKHPNIHIITLDVVNQESIEKSVEEVSKLVQEEGLNCLINNAGIKVVADFHSVTTEMMIENFHTNTVAPLMITKAPLSPEDSISFMLSVIGGLTEKDHGSFLNFTGEQIPW